MTATMNTEIHQILKRIALFGGLDSGQQKALIALMTEREFAAGERVFNKGDQASDIYIVIDGLIGLDFEQKDHPLSDIIIEPGFCFGETSLIGVQTHSASTYAIEPTKVLLLSGADLFGLYESDIKLFSALLLNIAREACRRLHATDELFLRSTQDSANELKKLPYRGF